MNQKHYVLTMTESEADIIGHALKQLERKLLSEANDSGLAASQLERCRAAYRNLDTCPESKP